MSTSNEVETALHVLIEQLLKERGQFELTAFEYPGCTIWLDAPFLDAAAEFKSIAGRHFSVKKAVGEIVNAVARVFERFRLATNPDRRFLLTAHPDFAERTKELGTMLGGLVIDQFVLPNGTGYGVLYDSIIVARWDIGTLVHEFVHAMMRDTDAEMRLLEKRDVLELFTDCLAHDAVAHTSWRDRFRGGDYIMAAKASDPTFRPDGYLASVLETLKGHGG